MLISDYQGLSSTSDAKFGCRANGIISLLKAITVLGSTGSIGTSTLDVIRRWPERFRVYALAAGQNVDALAQQILEFRPSVAVVATPEALRRLTERLRSEGLPQSAWPQLSCGPEPLVEIAI